MTPRPIDPRNHHNTTWDETSTPAPTDAGALDMRAALTQIDTIAVCVGVVDPRNFKTMLATIAGIARAALRNSAPQETRGDEPVAAIDLRSALQLLDSLDRIAEDFRRVEPCRHNNDNVISELKIELAGLREVLAAPQQSPRLEREGINATLERKLSEYDDTIARASGDAALSDTGCATIIALCLTSKQAVKAFADALLSPDTTVVSSTERCPHVTPPANLSAPCQICGALGPWFDSGDCRVSSKLHSGEK